MMHRRTFLQTGLLTTSVAFQEKYFSWKPAVKATPAADPQVINAGVGGNNTIDLLKRIDQDCLSHRPDLTILMAGTNDMNSMKYVPLPQYEANVRSMVKQIMNINSQVLLMTILPAYEPYLFTRHKKEFYEPEGYQERNRQVNEVIRKIAADNKLPVLDMHHVFEKTGNIGTDADSLLRNEANSGKTDGLHPTPEGYRLMGVVVYEAIIQLQLPHNKVVCFGDSITLGDGGVSGKSYPAALKRLLGS
ncbi:GDSL-type esterase/lipase family protein [Chitinophaga sp. RCC_12]|uniref:SGNH/GDSL hydrolase family protein n=1 Tax=Chitinophaga sp. RCC_12 TaxID=3239226 RepID=UPI0035265F9C